MELLLGAIILIIGGAIGAAIQHKLDTRDDYEGNHEENPQRKHVE